MEFEFAGRLSFVSAEGKGRGCGAAQDDGSAHEIEFQSKPEIAMDQIRTAVAESVDRGVVLADAAYGINGC